MKREEINITVFATPENLGCKNMEEYCRLANAIRKKVEKQVVPGLSRRVDSDGLGFTTGVSVAIVNGKSDPVSCAKNDMPEVMIEDSTGTVLWMEMDEQREFVFDVIDEAMVEGGV